MNLRKIIAVVGASAALMFAGQQAKAALVGVSAGVPDLNLTSLSIDYQAGISDSLAIFSSTATTGSYFDGVTTTNFGAGVIDLFFAASIDTSGVLSGGNFAACEGGDANGNGTGCDSGTVVVSGSLDSFGFQFATGSNPDPSSVVLDGTYTVVDSASATYPFPAAGETGNFILTFSGLPSGLTDANAWTSDFAATETGRGDITGEAPVPSTVALLAIGLLAAARQLRRA
jgi:hypothetical protein